MNHTPISRRQALGGLGVPAPVLPAPCTRRRSHPRADLTRRRLLGSGLAVGGGLLLGGCADDGASGANPSATPSPTAATRRVTNAFGTFDVPLRPSRVVVLEGRRDLETVLALGLSPIAIGSNRLDEAGKVPDFFGWTPPADVVVLANNDVNIEQVLALRPDLILARGSNIDAVLDKLVDLAPLVPVESGGPWRQDLLAVGETLGRAAQAQTAIARYDRRKAEVQAAHGALISSARVGVIQTGENIVYGSRLDGFYLQNQTLADLGGRPCAVFESDQLVDGYVELSLERLEEMADADVILLIASPDERAALEGTPLWPRLPAVSAGRVVGTDWRTNYGSAYAATECLDLLDAAYRTLPGPTPGPTAPGEAGTATPGPTPTSTSPS